MLQPAEQQDKAQQAAVAGRGARQQLEAANEMQQKNSTSSSISHQQQQQQEESPAAAAAAPLAAALPWDVVAVLPQSSPYSLDKMADADLALFVDYLQSARLGMPSVFELGVAREQGYRGRAQLLRRETLLRHLMQQVTPGVTSYTGDTSDIFSSSSSSSSSSGSSGGADGWEISPDGDSSSSSGSSGGWQVHDGKFTQVVTDEQLQELSNEQLAAAAESAAAACHAARGATGEEVGECLLDYFVFKR
jgi:uncharacterized membrane protein YgcG